MIKFFPDCELYQKLLYTPYLEERLEILNKEEGLHPDFEFHKKYIEWELKTDEIRFWRRRKDG